MNRFLHIVVLAGFALAAGARGARADEIAPKYQETITKGLDFLAKQQLRDGHWEANGGQYPMAMTALAGTALLMEGSTIREGKYADRIRRAVDWFLARSQPNGLLGNPTNPLEGGRYMYGHGFGVLFLSQVCGEEEDADRRKKLEDVLTRAVQFIGRAQSSVGGWNYVSAKDSGDGHEGSVTITQVQALRAARNAGIVVPKEILDKAHEYLKKSTTANGGVMYSLGGGGETGPLTAAAVACLFSAGEYDSPYAKRWLKYCQSVIRIDKTGQDRFGHYEYTHYYYAQVIYMLGEDGYAKLFPEAKGEQLKWSKYREVIFDYLASRQNADGSWTQGYIGPVYNTACFLTILQLDKGTLPIYQR